MRRNPDFILTQRVNGNLELQALLHFRQQVIFLKFLSSIQRIIQFRTGSHHNLVGVGARNGISGNIPSEIMNQRVAETVVRGAPEHAVSAALHAKSRRGDNQEVLRIARIVFETDSKTGSLLRINPEALSIFKILELLGPVVRHQQFLLRIREGDLARIAQEHIARGMLTAA